MEKSGLLHYQVKDTVLYRRIGNAHRKHVVRTAAQAVRVECRLHDMLHLVQADTEAEDLQEAFHPADDVIAAVRVPAGDVAGAEHAAVLVPLHQVLRTCGIAQGNVLTSVHHLADGLALKGLGSAVVNYREFPSGFRDADAAGLCLCQFRREIRHAGGTLGLSVGSDELPAGPCRIVSAGAEQFVTHPAASLGNYPKIRKVHAEETHLAQDLEAVWHAGEDGRAFITKHTPEPLVQHRLAAQQHGRTAVKVAGDDGQTHGVVHRKDGHGAELWGDAEHPRDILRVGLDVAVAVAHQLGAASGAGGGQQQGEVRVQVGRGKADANEAVAMGGEYTLIAEFPLHV